ncbi:hypothetical protein H2203_006229 [Taxawa tesnikishii (nom. ined.)]|nr:hypothetical protein H2203_006229 [Dothideales sp. JES 119]
MNIILLLVVLFLIPLFLLLAWFAFSSCLGDDIRAHFAGTNLNPRHATYGQHYARTMGSGAGQAGWEQIEMEDVVMNNKDWMTSLSSDSEAEEDLHQLLRQR